MTKKNGTCIPTSRYGWGTEVMLVVEVLYGTKPVELVCRSSMPWGSSAGASSLSLDPHEVSDVANRYF